MFWRVCLVVPHLQNFGFSKKNHEMHNLSITQGLMQFFKKLPNIINNYYVIIRAPWICRWRIQYVAWILLVLNEPSEICISFTMVLFFPWTPPDSKIASILFEAFPETCPTIFEIRCEIEKDENFENFAKCFN